MVKAFKAIYNASTDRFFVENNGLWGDEGDADKIVWTRDVIDEGARYDWSYEHNKAVERVRTFLQNTTNDDIWIVQVNIRTELNRLS